MADNYEDIPAGPVEEKDQPFGTAGDFAKTFGANALGIGSNLSAASRYMFEAGGGKHGAAISKAIGDIFSYGQEQITDSMNPKTKELLQSELTSDKFWEHPALGIAR